MYLAQLKAIEEANAKSQQELDKISNALNQMESLAKAAKETEQKLLTDVQNAEQKAQTLAQERDTLAQNVKRLQTSSAPKGIPPLDIQVYRV
jgi:hypothetical protein